MTPDYYAVLGVQATAEDEVIIAAYKALAKKYHPDTAGPASSAGRFVEIQEAYDVLRVPSRRAAYDRMRAAQEHDAQQKARAQHHGREAEHQPPGGKGPGGEPGKPTAARRFLAPMLAAAIAILLAAAMAVVVHVGRTVPVAEGGQDSPAPQDAPPVATDAGGKSDLSNEASGTEVSPAPETASSPAPGSKQIYDRIVGEQEIGGGQPTTGAPTIAIPRPDAAGKSSRPGQEDDAQSLPDVEPPPPLPVPGSEVEPPPKLPIPGSDQQG